MWTRRVLVPVLLGLALGVTALAAAGYIPGSYAINWWTVDAGGGLSAGGLYTVNGTAGQLDAGMHSGGSYQLTGGFWGGAYQPFFTYLPVTLYHP
jgi:hypothetical protein